MPLVYIDKGLWLSRWRSWERAVRFVGVWGAFGVLTLFYLIPIIAIQGLINIDQLRKIHVIAVIIDLPVVRSIITAILPGTVLRPFWAIQIAIPAVQNSLLFNGCTRASERFIIAAQPSMLQHLPICLLVLVYFHQCPWILRCKLVAQDKQLNH